MRAITILAAALCVWAVAAPATAQNHSAEAQAVLAVEDAYVAAELSRDELALRRIVDDQFALNRNDGTTVGKEAFVASILRLNMVGQTISERTVLVQGDVAVVFATTELRFASDTAEPTVSRLRYTATYRNRGGEWRMLALHMSPRS